MASEISIYCHSCGQNGRARYNNETKEYNCLNCHGSFVEEINQGVEEFLGASTIPTELPQELSNILSNSTIEEPSSSSASAVIVQNILSRLLGLDTMLDSNSNDNNIRIFQRGGGNDGRPIGVMIRPMGGIQSVRASNRDGDLPLGLLDLMASLGSIRQNSMNPDALSNTQFEEFLHHILMNENSHAGAPPATEDTLSNLDRLLVDESVNISSLGECCISQENFQVGDIVVTLPCGHRFKEDPITHWLKMHNTCPVCRISINASIDKVD